MSLSGSRDDTIQEEMTRFMTRLAVRTTDYTDREMGGMAGQEFLYKDLTYAIPSTGLRTGFTNEHGEKKIN